jgi:hypothetical protein
MSSRLVFTLVLAIVVAVPLSGCSLFDSEQDAPPASVTPEVTAMPSPGATPTVATETSESREPSFAPDGRTGIVELDALVDTLVTGDSGEILAAIGDRSFRALTLRTWDAGGRAIDMPPEQWSAELAASSRSLFTIVQADPKEFPGRDFNLVLRLAEAEYWNFAVRDSSVVEIVRSSDAVLTFPTGEPGFEYSGQANDFRLPSIERLPERYVVLPPPQDIPHPASGHDLSTRTGNQNVDAILSIIQASDETGLAESLSSPDSLLTRDCRWGDSTEDAAAVQEWTHETAHQAYSLHAVVEMPQGYQPPSHHLIILTTQKGPYWWVTTGLLEHNGKVVGLLTLNRDECALENLYLRPRTYILPPPDGGLSALEPGRRSGIQIIDAVLDAEDADQEGLVHYRTLACVDSDYGPFCLPGTTPGTLVEVIPATGCHGGFVTKGDEVRIDGGLYAVVAATDPGDVPPGAPTPDPERVTRYVAFMASASRGGTTTLTFSERGLTSIARGCGSYHPESRIFGAGEPVFLLPPP